MIKSDNANMSNENFFKIKKHRKSKVSCAILIIAGYISPKEISFGE